MRTPPSAMAEGAKNTFDYGGFAKPILPKDAHHITTGPIGLPKVIDDGKKRRYRAVGEGEGKSTFDSDGLVLPPKETDYVHHVSTGPPKFSKVPTAMDDSMKKYGAVGEGEGKSTFNSDGLVMPLSPKETDYVHHVSTGPQKFSKVPTAMDDPTKKYDAVGESKGESTFDSDGFVLPLSPKETDYAHHVSTGPPKFSKVPTSMDDWKKKYGAVGEPEGEGTFDYGGLVMPLLPKETDYVHHVSTSPQNLSNSPRALQTCALGDPTRYLPLLIGDGNFSDKNLHNSGMTPQGKKFPKSLALKNDEVVATHTSSARDDRDKGSGGARDTMAYQLFDGLVDPQNSSGLVKLVSAKPTACIYPTTQ
jgi:hypothetical protein